MIHEKTVSGQTAAAVQKRMIVVHGFGTYAILYRHMIELARHEAPDIAWSMILPTSHHLDAIREVLEEARVLCLEAEQARRSPEIEDLGELEGYSGNIYADIEAEKKIFKHRRGPEQVARAVEIYRIYKRFLKQVGATHVLLANIETFEGKVLVGLARELGIVPIIPIDCRNLGGIFFSTGAGENLPPYRRHDAMLQDQARKFLDDFRRNPIPASNPLTSGLEAETPLASYRKSFSQRSVNYIVRTLKKPQHFESALLAASIRSTFPKLRDWVRGFRARRNARQFDIPDLGSLPRKFIYYPLQTTPESSINTPAPYYVDQIRAIDALRFSMPSDFTLVVKEHPASIDVRPAKFYRALRRKAGVRLARYSIPSLDLIKRAATTVSVTGTATFEAFLLGRPSIVLGSSFIAEHLGGVCAIKDLNERIRYGIEHPPTDEAVAAAIAEIMSVRYDCLFRPPDEPGELSARPSNVRRLLRAILDHIRRLEAA